MAPARQTPMSQPFRLSAQTLRITSGLGSAARTSSINPESTDLLGTASPTNVPGARQNPVGWTDALETSGSLAGTGFDSTGQVGDLNDLWKYSAGEWIWMGGANVVNQPGVFGTLGAAAPGIFPGARDSGVSWTDASGNFWLFGGTDHDDSQILAVFLNTCGSIARVKWTWMVGQTAPTNWGPTELRARLLPANISRSSSRSCELDRRGRQPLAFRRVWFFGSPREAEIVTTTVEVAVIDLDGCRTCMANPRRMGFRGQRL